MKLLILAVVMIVLTLGCSGSKAKIPEAGDQLPTATLDQTEKLFKLITDIRDEYGTAFNQANFPDDDTKQVAKDWFKGKELYYEIIRIQYLGLTRSRKAQSVADLLALTAGFVEVPEAVFTKWEFKSGESGKQKFTKLSRLETLRDDYYVMAIALAREVK